MRRGAFILALLLGCSSGAETPASSTDTGGGSDSAALDTGAVDVTTDDTLPADTSPVSDTGPKDAPGDAVDPFGPYPSGPYGIDKGQTLANLDWQGYVNDKADAVSTTKPYVTTSLDQLRRKGNYGVIHVAEFT